MVCFITSYVSYIQGEYEYGMKLVSILNIGHPIYVYMILINTRCFKLLCKSNFSVCVGRIAKNFRLPAEPKIILSQKLFQAK